MTEEQIEQYRITLKEAFSDLVFEEEAHRYTVDGVELLSTTTSLEAFSSKFDANFMAPLSAKKWNRENPKKPKRTAEWFKREWNRVGKEASERGTRVHLFAEDFPNLKPPSCIQEQGVVNWFEQLPSHIVLLFAELRMYCKDIKKAGTADLIFLNTLTGKLIIGDWKSNSSNLFLNYANKKLKKPFTKLRDTKYNKYALQLSHYQLMIERKTPFEIEARWLIWLHEGDHLTLEEGKDPSKYLIEDVKVDVLGEGFKQFNLLPYVDDINDYHEISKVLPKIIKKAKAKPTKRKK